MRNFLAYMTMTLGGGMLAWGLFGRGGYPEFMIAGGLVLLGIGGGVRKGRAK